MMNLKWIAKDGLLKNWNKIKVIWFLDPEIKYKLIDFNVGKAETGFLCPLPAWLITVGRIVGLEWSGEGACSCHIFS